MITLAKKILLRQNAMQLLDFKSLSTLFLQKKQEIVKGGDKSSHSKDRLIVNKLFGELRERFATRAGGYTRIIRKGIASATTPLRAI